MARNNQFRLLTQTELSQPKELERQNTPRKSILVIKQVPGFFQASQKIGLIIGISEYGTLRREEGKEQFSNIETVAKDIKTFKLGLQYLNFPEKDITTL